MATQYTAGLTTGEVLTAATMNSIGATWETWTPTVTSTAGAITTSNLVRARYMRIQKLVIARVEFFITTAGAGAGGSLRVTLPITATTNLGVDTTIGFGREYNATGNTLNAILNSTTLALITNYDNTGPIQNNRGISAEFIYEAA
jgi:hypothetical protein